MSFVKRKFIVDGYHQDCLELRPKFGGVGEFDGQSVLVYFGYRLFLYTRANCGESGHRQVQVCVSERIWTVSRHLLMSPLSVFRYMQTYISRMCTEQIVERWQLLYQWPNRRLRVSRLREVSTWRGLQTDLTLALLCCCEPQRYTSDEPSAFQSTTRRWF